jgi:hypothetical protein
MQAMLLGLIMGALKSIGARLFVKVGRDVISKVEDAQNGVENIPYKEKPKPRKRLFGRIADRFRKSEPADDVDPTSML